MLYGRGPLWATVQTTVGMTSALMPGKHFLTSIKIPRRYPANIATANNRQRRCADGRMPPSAQRQKIFSRRRRWRPYAQRLSGGRRWCHRRHHPSRASNSNEGPPLYHHRRATLGTQSWSTVGLTPSDLPWSTGGWCRIPRANHRWHSWLGPPAAHHHWAALRKPPSGRAK